MKSYNVNDNVLIESLLPANLCLGILLISSEHGLQFETFRLQHVQMLNKTPGNWFQSHAESTAISIAACLQMFTFPVF